MGYLKCFSSFFVIKKIPLRSLCLFLLLLLILLVSFFEIYRCSSGQRDKFSFLINSFVSFFSHQSHFHPSANKNTRTEFLFLLHWAFFSLKLFCNARKCLVSFSFSQIFIIGPYINLFLIHVAYLLFIISKISNSAKSFVCWQIICRLLCLHNFLSTNRIFTKKSKMSAAV